MDFVGVHLSMTVKSFRSGIASSAMETLDPPSSYIKVQHPVAKVVIISLQVVRCR